MPLKGVSRTFLLYLFTMKIKIDITVNKVNIFIEANYKVIKTIF